jgi:hypothetical protein
MSKISFADRVAATGLMPKSEDLARLEALVEDMDRAAALVRGNRPYAEEPMAAFRLPIGSTG